jgi:hypothetical protein
MHILKMLALPELKQYYIQSGWLTLGRDVPGGGAEFVCSNMQSGAIGSTFGKNMTANSSSLNSAYHLCRTCQAW